MHGADGVNQPGGAAFAGRVDDDHIRDNAFFPEGSRGFGRIGAEKAGVGNAVFPGVFPRCV